MIDEAVGKILGMAMAYGVSALGLFLAYANYRRRTLGADRVMTPRAWAVVAAVVVLLAAGVLVVPVVIFLFATWVTVAIYRHFTRGMR